MVCAMILLKLAEWLVLANSCYRAAMKVKNHGFFSKNQSVRSQHQTVQSLYPSVTKCGVHNRGSQTLVCDIDGTLLRSQSFFPYFMLVAFEGGSILRAFILLLASPFLFLMDYKLRLRVMIFITFCGLTIRDMELVERAVLPKFYLENMNYKVYEIWAATGCRVVCTSVPKVMVQGFLKEYMSVDYVFGTELHTYGKYFSGLVSHSGLLVKHRALKEFFGDRMADIGISNRAHDYLFLSLFKVYI